MTGQASRRPARHVELGDKLVRIVEVLTPGGTEAWFEELAGLEPGESDGFEWACQRYGIEFLRDSPCTRRFATAWGWSDSALGRRRSGNPRVAGGRL